MLFDLPDRDTPPWALGNPPEPGNPFQLPSVESGPDLSVPHLASPTVDNQQRHSRPRPPSYPIMPTIADRLSSYTPAREISRLTAAIRRGRSQLNGGREQHADNFSHLLTIAAQATAASLTGNNPQAAVEELRRAAMALDPDDGSFDGFMEYLLSGRLSTQLARNIAINAEGRPQRLIDHTPAPLDFFRIFQLRGLSINNEPRQTARESLRRSLRPRRTPSISRNRASSLAALEEHSTGERQAVPDGVEGRVVPVLIVGIRALGNAGDGAQPRLEGEERLPSFLDALTNLGPGIQAPTNDDILGEGLQSYRNSERLRRRQRRRASMGAFFSADRPQRPRPTDVGRPRSEVGPSTASSTPSGPSPPPTTPASAPLSALSSGATTPNRPLAITNPDQSAHENESSSSRIPRTSTLNPTVEEPRPEEEIANLRRTQRRRSESDSMRYGSGSARRNGVVEPDHVPLDREGNRSWIIYVLGGNYPENHPILSTPSLFTESPTYEDMLLLSSLIGPAKPPVANEEDLASAGGLYTIITIGEKMAASAVEGEEFIPIEATQTCGICLTGYQKDEVTRTLKSCNHLFHRPCIDEVSLDQLSKP